MAATKLVRNSIGSEYRSFTPGVVSSSPTKRMNSSTAERVLVKYRAESSNLSSSSICECGEDGESQRSVKPLLLSSISSNLITHTNGERPDGHGCCLENRLGVKASRVRISFSPQVR